VRRARNGSGLFGEKARQYDRRAGPVQDRVRPRSLAAMRLGMRVVGGLVLWALGAIHTASRAQAPGVRGGAFVGSELEGYLRALQTLGLTPLYPWSIRGFSPHEVDALRPTSDAHPWRNDAAFQVTGRTTGPRWEVVPLRLDTWYNSAFPFGMNDGAVWKGRGLTTAVEGGLAARWGPVSLSIVPTIFWSENRDFALASNGQSGNLRYADALYWPHLDRPQRFGDRAYARIDQGQSSLRLDVAGLTAGVSTASQWWGPMTEFPYILGNNAAGFPHVFIGSSSPRDIWIGRLHARLMYGRLEQSAYTDILDPDSTVRLSASVIAVFSPRGVPGLELGAARFFHMAWPSTGIGWRELRKPFEGILKATLPREGNVPNPDPGQSSDNQLASLFARWVLPSAGFEVYGEYGREDHNWNTRDLLLEPDHSATYGIGFRKAWRKTNDRITALQAEIMNYQTSLLLVHRIEGGIYLHGYARQGHTHRGQLLGAAIGAASGSGGVLSLERYTMGGRSRFFWSRLVRQDSEGSPNLPNARTANALDVQHVFGAERIAFLGPLVIRGGVTAIYELNRDLRDDAVNLAISAGATWRPR
jgi:hypothetical protein